MAYIHVEWIIVRFVCCHVVTRSLAFACRMKSWRINRSLQSHPVQHVPFGHRRVLMLTNGCPCLRNGKTRLVTHQLARSSSLLCLLDNEDTCCWSFTVLVGVFCVAITDSGHARYNMYQNNCRQSHSSHPSDTSSWRVAGIICKMWICSSQFNNNPVGLQSFLFHYSSSY